MRRFHPHSDLARDTRFVRQSTEQRATDPRSQPSMSGNQRRFKASEGAAPDRARGFMHGIFVGEMQALEGAGRTCWDFEVGNGADEAPFALKLDMARQCWDEARHCEISVKLNHHMGVDIGEFTENTLLYEASCNPDPVLRLTGVNRALEGLAIDAFNTMRDFADEIGDPMLYFAEDWMLADEVTHVKMGSDWLRRCTENDPDRRTKALDFQRVVDKMFSFNGLRGEDDDNPIQLTREFRKLAGFSTDEIDEIAEMS